MLEPGAASRNPALRFPGCSRGVTRCSPLPGRLRPHRRPPHGSMPCLPSPSLIRSPAKAEETPWPRTWPKATRSGMPQASRRCSIPPEAKSPASSLSSMVPCRKDGCASPASRPLLLARQEAWSVKVGVPRSLPLDVRSSALPARFRDCVRQRVAADGPWVD